MKNSEPTVYDKIYTISIYCCYNYKLKRSLVFVKKYCKQNNRTNTNFDYCLLNKETSSRIHRPGVITNNVFLFGKPPLL